MGKDGFLTPKAIANRQKSKGLQKLRWYCEMCQKQCRDANGFKCHKMSEGHQRMMKVFMENSGKILDSYSREFERNFMNLVRVRWRTKRVYANKVYNEYISDKNHVHMNATVWQSLAGFVQHLGRTGQCAIDKTEKGWYIKYIDRDPEIMARQALIEAKEKMEVDDEARGQQLVEDMFNASASLAAQTKEPTELIKKEGTEEKVTLSFGTTSLAIKKGPVLKKSLFSADDDTSPKPIETNTKDVKPMAIDNQRDTRKRAASWPDSSEPPYKRLKSESTPPPKPKTALDEIAERLKSKQQFEERKKSQPPGGGGPPSRSFSGPQPRK